VFVSWRLDEVAAAAANCSYEVLPPALFSLRKTRVFMHKKAVSHFMGKFAGEVEIGSTPQGCQIFKNTSEFLCKFI
jgi:hypothetical protein